MQESRGFGFTLHRELVAAGAQSFLITPVALNRKRKTDKLDARELCQHLTRWLEGGAMNSSPSASPARPSNTAVNAPAAVNSSPARFGRWPIAATARWPNTVMSG